MGRILTKYKLQYNNCWLGKEMRKRILITLCLSLLISSNSRAADSASKCFDRLANKPLPFEIYREYGDQRVFFQPVGDRFGLSDNAIPFIIPDADAMGYSEFGVAPLCNGNYVTIRRFSHPNFPIPLTGRIIGEDYMPLGKDFLISDAKSSNEGGHSVATIYPKGFVVAWTAWDGPKRKAADIKARLFDQSGKPLGPFLKVSTSTSSGLLGNAIVRGLPNGGFVVAWDRYHDTTYFRVFDGNGKPKTNEVVVGKYFPENPQKDVKREGVLVPPFPRPCKELLSISTTREGFIDVFMNCYFNKPDKTSPFEVAQRFDSNGRPLTAKLTGLEMQNLSSYTYVLDQYVKDKAGKLDVSLRHDFQRSTQEKTSCPNQYSWLVIAAETKPLTTDPRLRRFFTEYCQTFQNNCITYKLEENVIEKCTRGD